MHAIRPHRPHHSHVYYLVMDHSRLVAAGPRTLINIVINNELMNSSSYEDISV